MDAHLTYDAKWNCKERQKKNKLGSNNFYWDVLLMRAKAKFLPGE